MSAPWLSSDPGACTARTTHKADQPVCQPRGALYLPFLARAGAKAPIVLHPVLDCELSPTASASEVLCEAAKPSARNSPTAVASFVTSSDSSSQSTSSSSLGSPQPTLVEQAQPICLPNAVPSLGSPESPNASAALAPAAMRRGSSMPEIAQHSSALDGSGALPQLAAATARAGDCDAEDLDAEQQLAELLQRPDSIILARTRWEKAGLKPKGKQTQLPGAQQGRRRRGESRSMEMAGAPTAAADSPRTAAARGAGDCVTDIAAARSARSALSLPGRPVLASHSSCPQKAAAHKERSSLLERFKAFLADLSATSAVAHAAPASAAP